ncbi:MAG TPA: glycosyl hydrolase family 18 protein [Candidatus Atribacteria bacterium]|nr:glycosyl hydrolase family 18 protein [Candidatus Atribacteria bacterium]
MSTKVSEKERYRNVGYLFSRGCSLPKIDVTKVTHLNIAFGLIYNEEYKEIGPEKNSHVAVPADFCPGKQHTIYLSPAVAKILSRVDKLKAENPDLKILLSIGGWGARGFSDAAATEEGRKRFARSCKEIIDQFGLQGIDLDWEYPVGGGGIIKARPEDKHNFTLLLQEVREAIGEDKILSIAGAAMVEFTGSSTSPDDGRWTEFDKIIPILDYINIMTYDFQFGSNYFGSALYWPEDWPPRDETEGYWVSKAVENYLSHGCPADKINLGLAFATPIPQIVRESPHWGEIEKKLKAAGWYDSQEPPLKKVKDLLEDKNGFTKEWDRGARMAYIATEIDGQRQLVLSYIEPRGLTEKLDYVKELGLGGAMFWEFGADYDNSLVTQIAEELFIV